VDYSTCDIEIDLREQNPAYWANMAFSLQRDDKPEKAEKYYKKALELDPDNATYLINLGYVLSEQRKDNEAVNYLRYAVNIAPDFVEGWINLALAYIDSGMIADGLVCCNKGLELDSSNAVLWNNRGYAYALRNELKNAISDYKESLRLRPNNIDTMYHIASAYYSTRQYAKAEKVYNDILAFEPDHPIALYWKRVIADFER
jgi:Tfp pilus assembly protein PilF